MFSFLYARPMKPQEIEPLMTIEPPPEEPVLSIEDAVAAAIDFVIGGDELRSSILLLHGTPEYATYMHAKYQMNRHNAYFKTKKLSNFAPGSAVAVWGDEAYKHDLEIRLGEYLAVKKALQRSIAALKCIDEYYEVLKLLGEDALLKHLNLTS